MQALLLAGGRGTRLRSVVNDRPKPMALVEGKPFLEYLLTQLKKNDITDIIFAVGYKGSMIEEYFGDGSKFGIKAEYSYEKEQLGTAGAIKNAADFIKDDYFFVLNADTYYNLDYSRLVDMKENTASEMVLVLREVSDKSRYGSVSTDGDRVTGFNEKSEEAVAGLINGGIYYMSKKLLEDIPDRKCSLENEMIPKWLDEEMIITAYVNDGYFIDIGVPEDYFRFQKDVRENNL